MVSFRTEIKLEAAPFEFNVERPSLFIGSCFAAAMGGHLAEAGLPATVNPSGLLFNPLSIARIVGLALDPDCDGRLEAGLSPLPRDGHFVSPLFDSSVHATSPDGLLAAARSALCSLRCALTQSETIVITAGTAWIYLLEGCVVANCHKLHPSRFVRRRAGVDELTRALHSVVTAVRGVNPNANFILTVSPVRHLADGLHGNSLSKASLLLASDNIVALGDAIYFPAFEILNDDLRDYRFYDRSMTHPAPLAVDYIRETFLNWIVSPSGRQLVADGQRRFRASCHRPILKSQQ